VKYQTVLSWSTRPAHIVNNVVVKDRVLLAEEGLVAVVLTIDKRTGGLLTSPDIISRGFIYMREQEEVMNGLTKRSSTRSTATL
jgi:ribonuclease J